MFRNKKDEPIQIFRKTKFFLSCLILFASCIFGHLVAVGQTTFVVRTVLPPNQIDSSVTYFDLEMTPNYSQVIYVELINNGDVPIRIEAEVDSATTNDSGRIMYHGYEGEIDTTLQYRMEDIISFESVVEVPENQTYRMPITIRTPGDHFHGVLAGAFTFTLSENNVGGVTGGPYLIAILLRQGSHEEIFPELVLSGLDFEHENNRTQVISKIRNINPTSVDFMTINSIITRDSDGTVVFEEEQTDMQMAPNSNFNFALGVETNALQVGSYTLTLNIMANGRPWELITAFEITEEDVNDTRIPDTEAGESEGVLETETRENPRVFEDPENMTFITIILLGSLGLIVIIVLIIVSRHQKRAKIQQLEEMQQEMMARLLQDDED